MKSVTHLNRVLKEEGQLNRRGRQPSRKKSSRPTSYTAIGPNQVFTWDITYMPSGVRGQHYYLYMIEDIYSRKIVGYDVYDRECGELASQLLQRTLMREQCFNQSLVLHFDNGAPMKSLTFKAKMEGLGITSSYGRPRVSDGLIIDESYRGGLGLYRESIQPLIPSEFKFIGYQWSD